MRGSFLLQPRSRNSRSALGSTVPAWIILGVLTAGVPGLSARAEDASRADEAGVPEWWTESMRTREDRIQWFKEARFGMFVHWGAYAVLAGEWEGKPVDGYSEHIMRSMRIPVATYRREVVARFNPVKFEADAWIGACRDAGMRYFVITAKHHDGFAMWDSGVTDYDIVEATPFGRDPMVELRDACRRYGVRFGFYYSHAQDWESPYTARNNWDYPGNPVKPGWWSEPEFRDHAAVADQYVEKKGLPQLEELLRGYDPDIMWFDTARWMEPSRNLRFLEMVRRVKPDTVVNSRIMTGRPFPDAIWGDYQCTNDRPLDFAPQPDLGAWEGLPTTNESYGFHKHDHSHKPASFFIELLAKAGEKGGNLLMNIGPRPDGTIDPADLAILQGIGRWMNINGEAIWGAERSPLVLQPWGHITRKGRRLFLHVTRWPADGILELAGLAAPVEDAFLLADPSRTPLEVSGKDGVALIQGPPTAPDPVDSVVVVDCGAEPVGVPGARRLLSGRVPDQRLHVFDAEKEGSGLRDGSGNPRDDYVHGWREEASALSWKVFLTRASAFEVGMIYNAHPGMGGRFCIKDGETVLLSDRVATRVSPDLRNLDFSVRPVGTIILSEGRHDIKLGAIEITGRELMLPTALVLEPVLAEQVTMR